MYTPSRNIHHIRVNPCSYQYAPSLSRQGSRFNLRPVYVKYLVDIVVLTQGSSEYFGFLLLVTAHNPDEFIQSCITDALGNWQRT